jgi:hypothetical protein
MRLYLRSDVRVLVLHAASDAAPASDLKAALHQRGAEVVSHERLNKDGSWTSWLEAEFKTADLVVVIHSSQDDSRNLLFELGQGVAAMGKERVVVITVADPGRSSPIDLAGFIVINAGLEDMGGVASLLLQRANTPPPLTHDVRDSISETLERLGATWQAEAAVAGVRADYLIETKDGRRAIIEVKANARPTVLDIADARADAARLAEVVGAEFGLAVFAIPHLVVDAVGVTGFRDVEKALTTAPPSSPSGRPAPEVMPGAKAVFAAMPFAAEYEDVYFVAMVDAARAVGAACRRLDREDYAGDIVQRLTELIAGCDAIIADISDANPNVLYEVGYAHALGRPAIHICSTPLTALPFDVRNWNTIEYAKGQTHALRQQLTDRLRGVLSVR